VKEYLAIVVGLVALIAVTWGHFAEFSPWLMAHGSSAAFKTCIGLWAGLLLGWGLWLHLAYTIVARK
jgi:hypothetical protein